MRTRIGEDHPDNTQLTAGARLTAVLFRNMVCSDGSALSLRLPDDCWHHHQPSCLEVTTPWPTNGRQVPRRAVSRECSGENVHVLLGLQKMQPSPTAASTFDRQSLGRQVRFGRRAADCSAASTPTPGALGSAYTLAAYRSVGGHREQRRRAEAGRSALPTHKHSPRWQDATAPVWLFSGQGSQAAMRADLLTNESVLA